MTHDISHELRLLGLLREFPAGTKEHRDLLDRMRLVVCKELEAKLSLNSQEKA